MGRKRYTDVEKAAFKKRDNELAEAADAALAEPDAGARATAIALRSPKLAAYSLRNQMMLAHQAEKAGIELHDVDTARGWAERGRTLAEGTTAVMRIVYPIRRKTSDDTEPAEGSAEGDGEGEAKRGTLFRTKAVFEISQTEQREGFVPDPDAEPEGDPAAIWHDRLLQEATKLGYTIEQSDTEDGTAAAVVDAESATITLTAADPLAPEALSALAQRIAEVQTAAKADGSARQTKPEGDGAAPDAGTVLEFD